MKWINSITCVSVGICDASWEWFYPLENEIKYTAHKIDTNELKEWNCSLWIFELLITNADSIKL